MTNSTLTETQQTYAGELLNPENTVYFKFHAGKSMTDYVTIEVASIELDLDPGKYRAVCHDMTYHLAKNFGLGLGRRNTARELQIPMPGCGYNKAFQTAYELALNLGLSLDTIPKNWRY